MRYAARTRMVVNVVRVNEDPASAMIRGLEDELKALRGRHIPLPKRP